MAPLTPRLGHGLLRCPICRLELATAGGALACGRFHTFDLAREGYVNLLRKVRERAAARGDSSEQLRHRAAFLERGHFDIIANMITSCAQGAGHAPVGGRWRVLDAGSGTGYHLARVTAALEAPTVGLGLDIARDAARHAARRWQGLAFAVADLWGEWPVHNASIDLVINIFAPKNFSEMTRVLRPGGWLAVVCPGPKHFRELNRRFGLMHQQENKTRHYIKAMSQFIGPSSVTRHLRRVLLDSAAIRDAVLMGPNARHIGPSAFDLQSGPLSVTLDLALLLARKSDARP